MLSRSRDASDTMRRLANRVLYADKVIQQTAVDNGLKQKVKLQGIENGAAPSSYYVRQTDGMIHTTEAERQSYIDSVPSDARFNLPTFTGFATLATAAIDNPHLLKQDYTFSNIRISSSIPLELSGVLYAAASSEPIDSALRLGQSGVQFASGTDLFSGITLTVNKACLGSTQYIYARAYAKNSAGEGYGNIIGFINTIPTQSTANISISQTGTFTIISYTEVNLGSIRFSSTVGMSEYGIIWWIDNSRSPQERLRGDAGVTALKIGNYVNANVTISESITDISWPDSGVGSLAQWIHARVYTQSICPLADVAYTLRSLKLYKYVSGTSLVTLWPGLDSSQPRRGELGPPSLSLTTSIFGDYTATSEYPAYTAYSTFLPNIDGTAVSTLDSDFAIDTGIQRWVTPRAGIYKIEAWGGTPLWRDSNSPNEHPKQVGYVVAHFNLPSNRSLSVVVGQAGNAGGGTSYSPGAGATMVYCGNLSEIRAGRVAPTSGVTPPDHHLLMVAGGTAGFLASNQMTDADADKTQCPITLVTSTGASTVGGTAAAVTGATQVLAVGGGGGGFKFNGESPSGGGSITMGGRGLTISSSTAQGGVFDAGTVERGGFGGGGAVIRVGGGVGVSGGAGGGGGFSGGNGGGGISAQKATGGTSFLNTSSPFFDSTRDYSNKPGGTPYGLVRPGGLDTNAGRSMIKITWFGTA